METPDPEGSEQEPPVEEETEQEPPVEETALDCNSIGSTPGSWVLVPGNPDYQTDDFCMMKYEAKCSSTNGQLCSGSQSVESQASNTPWVNLTQAEASQACSALGAGFKLITNKEWMTIATDIADVSVNWSNNGVGDGQLLVGHSDDSPGLACAASADDNLNVVEGDCANRGSASDDFVQQRTHTLSNGQIIWDLGGNVREWTSDFNNTDKPSDDGIPDQAWREYTSIDGTSTLPLTDLIPQIAIDNSWNTNQKIGMYFAGFAGFGGVLRRGGDWDDGITNSGGLFTASLRAGAIESYDMIGFRCSYSAP